MKFQFSPRRLLRAQPVALSAAALGVFAPAAAAQSIIFSIDYRGASIGTPATGGGCITEADLLAPPTAGGIPAYGPLPPPVISISGGFGPPAPGLGIPGLPCHPAGMPSGREVDAVSRGADFPIKPLQQLAGTYVFSVDACSMGIAGAPLAPNVGTETPPGDSAADVFESLALPAAPIGPGPIIGNSGIIDGNGLASGSGALYPGVGLIEPRFPGPALTGDDVDAIDIGPVAAVVGPVYFSLDSAFPNVCSGFPNTGSAAANGFLPGAVLVTMFPGGPPALYAPPAALGLDLLGPGTDDLDALALAENGVAGYQVAAAPYAWFGMGADMLLFSVRRGSAVIGLPDSIFGMPIEPGDILVPPVVGGVSPFPGIFVAAESLGLATMRGGFGMAAEMDALDTVMPPQTGLPYCFGTAATCPCGNAGAPGNGCANGSSALGANLSATGNAKVSADTVLLSGTNMPPFGPALYFQGTAQIAVPFGDGLQCAGGVINRLVIKFNDATGASATPTGADPAISLMGGVPAAGGTFFYQIWYRDASPFCPPAGFNLSNGDGIVWIP